MPPDRLGARARAEARAPTLLAVGQPRRPPTYDELAKRVQELEAQAESYRERIRNLETAVVILNREKANLHPHRSG